MACTYPQDHATYWAGNPDMERKTREYEQEAKRIVENGLFGEGTRHPWMDSGLRGDARVRFYEFVGEFAEKHASKQFDNDRDHFLFLHGLSNNESPKRTTRRLIILEDMDPRFVEMLGVLLNIPPIFFLAHCEELVQLSALDATYGKQGCSRYWRVPVPQARNMPSDFHGPHDRYLIEAGSFDRWSSYVESDTSSIGFNSQVSYWGHQYGEESWTAVLLVDPPETHLRYVDVDGPIRIKLEDYTPKLRFLAETIPDPSQVTTELPFERFMFDALEKAHARMVLPHTPDSPDPFTGTAYARNLVRSAWEDNIYREFMNVHDTVVGDARDHKFDRGTEAADHAAKQDNETVKQYHYLLVLRQYIKEKRMELRGIIWAFRCGEEGYRDQYESRVWKQLEEQLGVLEADSSDHMVGFSQRAAMEESFAAKVQAYEASLQTQTANRQARSAAQLTKIATVIVPCTFVGSIFSMNGDFAAGEKLFYVYWAISIPVTLTLLAWVIWGDDMNEWKNKKKEKVGRFWWTPEMIRKRIHVRPSSDEEKGDKED